MSFWEQSNDRHVPPDYSGPLLLWDIDKTYLDTHFSSWRGLAVIPFEFAVDKHAVPGAVPLLRSLRHGPGAQSGVVPLYFISGSPPQLRKTVERKMTLDGVEYDGITFKDQLGLLLARRPKDIKGQVGYKLKALLGYRRQLPLHARWHLFGDDVESDAEVFALFGEVCAGLRGTALEAQLARQGVHKADLAEIRALSDGEPVTANPVERIYILLVKGRDPKKFEPNVVPARSYLQTALVTAHHGLVRPETIAAVAKDLRRRRIPEDQLIQDRGDAVTRLGVPESLAALAVQN